jgi:uncharacterized membrane protein
MNLNTLLLAVHVLGAMALVAGVVARQIARAEARQAGALAAFLALDTLAGRYEDRLVRPASLAVGASGLGLALWQGWPLLGFLQGAEANWLLVANLLVVGTILIIPLVFIPRGRGYERIRQAAVAAGEITPELRQALDDPVVRAGHIYEAAALAAVIVLMITRPF